MKILGISLGHDSNLALIEDGRVIAVMEAERFFRQKRYKLSAEHLEAGKFPSTYQYTDVEDLKLFLNLVKKEWGDTFDHIAVQNQGRKQEFENLKTLLVGADISYGNIYHVDHHLSHASLSYFTSPFSEALVLSYDGIGNDGKTVFFQAEGNKLVYLANIPIAFGQSYNNLGYIIGVSPEIEGTTSGKTMGLTSYGAVRETWLPYAREYVLKYQKFPTAKLDGLQTRGLGHRINDVGLRDIPELKKYLQPRKYPFEKSWRTWLGLLPATELRLPGPKDQDSQDLAATVQQAWTEEVLELIQNHKSNFLNLCIVGGCALNGTTNYVIEQSGLFERTHFIPNPSDCGLASGAALYVHYALMNHDFTGSKEYFSPYLGSEPFDKEKLEDLKNRYPYKEVPEQELSKKIAELVAKNLIIGFINGRYEIGPRALGNRSILCNPLNPEMRDILNDKVKHREWYRPFAPMVTEEDAPKYFTNPRPVPYMSVICDTREEYREKLPSITHVDGTARIQTVRQDQNPLIYSALKEFEEISGCPIFLNTSFNPAGEPILNFCEVGLEMLAKTDLDLVIIGNTVFSNHAKKHLLEII
ncbi:MAG: carbamoyltransferase C-terminal domain-containing protein [bacterium]|nr:carbamoyltransferase C-terminal domain-containing protein [bacterium]